MFYTNSSAIEISAFVSGEQVHVKNLHLIQPREKVRVSRKTIFSDLSSILFL